MAVRVVEQRLGTVPWLVVHGPAAEAFASLGAHPATDIRAVVEGLPSLAALRRYVASEPGKHGFAAVRRATQSRSPGPWAELTALAAGAGVTLWCISGTRCWMASWPSLNSGSMLLSACRRSR